MHDLLSSQQEEINKLNAAKDQFSDEADEILEEDVTENAKVKAADVKKWFLKTIGFEPTPSTSDGDNGASPESQASTLISGLHSHPSSEIHPEKHGQDIKYWQDRSHYQCYSWDLCWDA